MREQVVSGNKRSPTGKAIFGDTLQKVILYFDAYGYNDPVIDSLPFAVTLLRIRYISAAKLAVSSDPAPAVEKDDDGSAARNEISDTPK